MLTSVKHIHLKYKNVKSNNQDGNLDNKYGIDILLTLNEKWTASVFWWSEFLATDPEVRVRFLALPDFLRSSESGTGFTQPREYN
jgi:hypothetical protein